MIAEASLLQSAEEAVRLAQLEPERARALARDLLSAAENAGAYEVAVLAERALGLVAREFDELPEAIAHFERAISLAVTNGLPVRAAQARMSLALTLAYRGQSEEALEQTELAAPDLAPVDLARLELQRALILQRLGRLDEALEGYERALPVLRRAGESGDVVRLVANRGVAHAYRGNLQAAEADLDWAAQRLDELGQALAAAKVRHNLGFVAARRGDVPAALQWYDRAEGEYRRLGVSTAISLIDRAETLLSVRLIPEATAAARQALQEFDRGGMDAEAAQARLLIAQALLLQGSVTESSQMAMRARERFLEQQRPGWAALAAYAWLRARWVDGDRSLAMLETAGRVVEELAATGWAAPATEAHLIAASIALELGLASQAETKLRRVSRARRTGTAEIRARAWHAEALLREAHGDSLGALTALRAGMQVLAGHQSTLGATELRVHAATRGEELAASGLRIARAQGRADRVLEWAERGRASALRYQPALPAADADLATSLAELRRVVSLLEDRALEAEATGPLLRRQAQLEARIRRESWRAGGDGTSAFAAWPGLSQLSQALGNAALVEFVQIQNALHAITVRQGRAQLHSLADPSDVETKVTALRFALRRIAVDHRKAASGAYTALAELARELDEILVKPLLRHLGDDSLVVVPTGPTHGMAWSCLPSLRGRTVSVTPSAALWFRAASASRSAASGCVFVAGPGLRHATQEVTEVARLHPGAMTLTASEATVEQVLQALATSELVHIAAHGTFRSDNPLFSSIRMVDGPVTVYDIERVRHSPRDMVLSACSAGESTVSSGDELMGLSSALLSLGTRTLVASLLPVPDEITRCLMVEFHRALLRGLGPAAALAQAQTLIEGDDDERGASATAFVCLGAG